MNTNEKPSYEEELAFQTIDAYIGQLKEDIRKAQEELYASQRAFNRLMEVKSALRKQLDQYHAYEKEQAAKSSEES